MRVSRESPYGLSIVPSNNQLPSEAGSRLSKKNLAFLEEQSHTVRVRNTSQQKRTLEPQSFDTNKPYGVSIVEHEYGSGTSLNQKKLGPSS